MNRRFLSAAYRRRTSLFAGLLAAIVYLMGTEVIADTVDFTSSTPLATFQSDGLVDISNLGSWNGGPVTEDNQPSAYQRRLSASFDFFGVEGDSNAIWLRVSNVISTQGSYWFGSAFTNTIMTGIGLEFRSSGSLVDVVGCDFDFANPGQSLLGTEEGPVSETLGWELLSGDLQTQHYRDYGFAEFGWVTGAVIQEGGGLFRLHLSALVSDIDWSQTQVVAGYGQENQVIDAVFSNPVPGLGTGFGMAFSIFAARGRRR